jgi:hypothetical protein
MLPASATVVFSPLTFAGLRGAAMAVSVVDPVSPAIERVKTVCFRPFDMHKWFVLGFCAFLAQLGEGGGSNFNTGGQGGDGSGGPDLKEMKDWIEANLGLAILIALIALLVIIGLTALFTWLGSRGKFMFIDGIVHNRAAVKAPWSEFRREGNSLFSFRIVLVLATYACFLVLGSIMLLIALPDIRSGTLTGAGTTAIVIGIAGALIIGLSSSIVTLFLLDFIAPIMYLRRLPVMEAWSVFRHEFLDGRTGTFVLYIVFKILIGICVGLLAAVITCVTCCLPAIPYIGSVILLPLLVFGQAYPLYFIQQFGSDWRFFHRLPPPLPDEPSERRDDEGGPPDDRIIAAEE